MMVRVVRKEASDLFSNRKLFNWEISHSIHLKAFHRTNTKYRHGKTKLLTINIKHGVFSIKVKIVIYL